MDNKVRSFRIAKGIKASELRRAAGISQSCLYYIETGQKNPKVDTARKIAQALGTTVDELFGAAVRSA